MENIQNSSVSNEDIPTEDIDTINKTNPFAPKDEIENNNLVTTSVDILSSSELIITYKNESEKLLSYGEGHDLQVLDGKSWVEVAVLPNVGWHDISLNLNPGETFKEDINLKTLYGELKVGHYRINKEMFVESSKINVTVEFDIEQE